MRGECYCLTGQLNHAIQDFDAVMKLDPNYVWNGRLVAKDGLESIMQHVKQMCIHGNHVKAIPILDAMIAIKQLPSLRYMFGIFNPYVV